jgi:calcineurin-like phosphoesterase family protein
VAVMEVWFTSDTHFGSKRTLEFSQRPFKTVEDMDTKLIENWNSVVSDNDLVYHLGDFGVYDLRKQLNGDVALIAGNYDTNVPKGLFKWVTHYDKLRFDNIEIYMNHFPSLHKKGAFNLFGHVHKLCMVKRYGLNVGVDCHNFYPISLETVLFYKNAIENHYDKEVFE